MLVLVRVCELSLFREERVLSRSLSMYTICVYRVFPLSLSLAGTQVGARLWVMWEWMYSLTQLGAPVVGARCVALELVDVRSRRCSQTRGLLMI